MELTCIHDTCPKDKQFVNHLKCRKCELNPMGEQQPQFARQECLHIEARHEPNPENWQHLKSLGSEVLSVMLVRV